MPYVDCVTALKMVGLVMARLGSQADHTLCATTHTSCKCCEVWPCKIKTTQIPAPTLHNGLPRLIGALFYRQAPPNRLKPIAHWSNCVALIGCRYTPLCGARVMGRMMRRI